MGYTWLLKRKELSINSRVQSFQEKVVVVVEVVVVVVVEVVVVVIGKFRDLHQQRYLP
jgi:hypothetical protein